MSASVIICNRGRPFIVHLVFFILRRSQYATRRITLLGSPFDRFDRYCHRTGTDSSGRPLNHNVFYFIIYSSIARSIPTAYSVFYMATLCCPIILCACSGSWFRALSERLIAQRRHTDQFVFFRTVESITIESRCTLFFINLSTTFPYDETVLKILSVAR